MNLAVFRVQNPGTGRWTSQDPLGFAAGDADLERYPGNEPADASDPSGLLFGLAWEKWTDGLIIGPQALAADFAGDYDWIMSVVGVAVNSPPINPSLPAGCTLTDERGCCAMRHGRRC